MLKRVLHNFGSLMKGKIFRNFLYLLSGRVTNAGLNMLLLLVLTNGLLPGEFGNYTYFFAAMTAIPFLLDLGLDNAFISIGAPKYTQDSAGYYPLQHTYVVSKVWLALTIFVVSTALLVARFITPLMWASCIFGVVIGLGESLLAIFRATNRFKTISFLLPLHHVLCLASNVALLLMAWLDLQTAIISYGLASIIYVWVLIYYCGGFRTHARFDLPLLRQMLLVSKWLLLYNLAIVLTMRVDIFFLKYYADRDMIADVELGYYGAAFRLAFFLPLVTSTMTAVLLPAVSTLTKRAEILRYIRKITLLAPIVAVLLGAVLVASGPVIHFALGGDYDASISIFRILVLGVSLTVFTNTLLLLSYPTNRVNWLVGISALQLGLNIVLDLIFIPSYGALGASYAMMGVRVLGLLLSIVLAVSIVATFREAPQPVVTGASDPVA